MAAVTSLQTHLVDELVDLLDAENQLTEALPKLAKAATAKELMTAFEKHLKETRLHIARLNQALRGLGQEKPQSKTCEAMKGLLKEGESMMNKTPAGALRDAVMITGAQKVEHYEMASYGTARTYAQVLGKPDVAQLLEQTLNEEKAADRTLTSIAENRVNEAAEEWQSQEEPGDGALIKTAEWVGATAGQITKGIRKAASVVGITAQESQTHGKESGQRESKARPHRLQRKPKAHRTTSTSQRARAKR